MKCACMGCTEATGRSWDCHTRCDGYKEFQAKNEEEKNVIKRKNPYYKSLSKEKFMKLKEREEYRNKVNDNKGGTRMNVKNQYGKEVNFDEALKLMDADLRENVAYELSLSSDQEFFDKYAEAHKKKFGTTWEPDRE